MGWKTGDALGGGHALSSVRVKDVSKVFRSVRGEEVKALDNISFEVKSNEFLAVIGPSGCGKTTLLNLLAGFEDPTTGAILLDGRKIEGPSSDKTVVFQEFALFPWYTVFQNVSFGLEMKSMAEPQRCQIVQHYINLVGLAGFENRYPRELSGGMRQRVAIARALAVQPQLLLLDEPLGSLDAQTRAFMQGELLKIWEKERKTVFLVTHSIDEALQLADRVLVMTRRPGRVKGIYEITVERPRDEGTADIVKLRREINLLLLEEVAKMHEAEMVLNSGSQPLE